MVGDVEVVADQQEGRADLGAELADEVEDLLGIGGVEGAGGLVGQDEARAVGQGAGDGDALLLADGEFGGAVVQAIGQADLVEEVDGPGAVGAFGR